MYKPWTLCGKKSPNQCLEEIENQSLSESSTPRSFSSIRKKTQAKDNDYGTNKKKKSLRSNSRKSVVNHQLKKNILHHEILQKESYEMEKQRQPPHEPPAEKYLQHLKCVQQSSKYNSQACQTYGFGYKSTETFAPLRIENHLPNNKIIQQKVKNYPIQINPSPKLKIEKDDCVRFNDQKFYFPCSKTYNPQICDAGKKCESQVKFSYFPQTQCSEKSSFITKLGETESKLRNKETLLREYKSVSNLRSFGFKQTQSIADDQEKSEISIVVDDIPFVKRLNSLGVNKNIRQSLSIKSPMSVKKVNSLQENYFGE